MRENWRETTLAEICSSGGAIQTGPFGSQLHAEDYRDEGVPVVMPVNIGDNRIVETGIARVAEEDAKRLQRHRVRVGDVLYSRRGDITRRALVRPGQDGWLCGTGCLLVRPGSDIDPTWLSYWLGTPRVHEWLARHAVGATMPNLNTGILAALPVLLPPIGEQIQIARVLGTIDDLIEVNRRVIPASRDLAIAVLQRAASRGPRGAVSAVADVRRGLSYKGSGLSDHGIPMVNMGSADNFGWLKRSGWKYYVGDFKDRHKARGGDLIITNTEQTWRQEILGWPLLVPGDVDECLFTHHTYLVDFHPVESWRRLALWAHLYTNEARETLVSKVQGSTVANLPIKAVEDLAFPCPPEGDASFVVAAGLLSSAWDAELEVRRLESLRDELLPLLLSGLVHLSRVAA